MSANSDRGLEALALAAGAAGFVAKRFDADQLHLFIVYESAKDTDCI